MNTLKGLLGAINSLISRLNRTPVKRIIIYVIVIYPLFFGFYYKDEILMALSNDDKREVIIKYLDRANKRCFDLREKWRAESVMLYIYQPEGIQKTEKERISISTGSKYKPLEQNDVIQLVSRTKVIEDLRENDYAKITPQSGHALSSILFSYDLEVAYIVPIKDRNSNAIIGEVIYVFQRDEGIEVIELIQSSQMFSYDIF